MAKPLPKNEALCRFSTSKAPDILLADKSVDETECARLPQRRMRYFPEQPSQAWKRQISLDTVALSLNFEGSMKKIIALVCMAAMSMCGCTFMTTVKLYEGPDRAQSQIALVYIDPHVWVSRVDSSKVLASSAGKRREVMALEPGNHEFAASFFLLCRQSVGQTVIRFTAEAGKSYRLRADFADNFQRWSPSIVEYRGEPIDSEFPWTRALCPANVQVVR